jgi:hypothetical protein
MAIYKLGDKEVSKEEFDKAIEYNRPFFLDQVVSFSFPAKNTKTDEEILKTLLNPHLRGSELREEWKTTTVDMSKAKGKNVFEGVTWISDKISAEESKNIEDIREACLNTRQYLGLEYVTKILRAESEEELESILKRDMSIGAPDWSQNYTGGTVFEKIQDSNLTREVLENFNKAQIKFIEGSLPEHPNFLKLWKEKHKNLVNRDKEMFKSVYPNIEQSKLGKKENKNKPQLSLLFKQFPKALEAITKCSEYGNNKYKETDKDFLNFKRVEGGSKTYADSGLRHRLQTGLDESGLPHQYHVDWNALAELELWIEENEQKIDKNE